MASGAFAELESETRGGHLMGGGGGDMHGAIS